MKRTIYFAGLELDTLANYYAGLPNIELRKGILNTDKAFPTIDQVLNKECKGTLAIKIDFDDELIELSSLIGIYAKNVDIIDPNDVESCYCKTIAYNDMYLAILAKAILCEEHHPNFQIKIEKMCSFFPI